MATIITATADCSETPSAGTGGIQSGGTLQARSTQRPTYDTGHCGPGERVPKDHPLRRIKAVADAALTRLSPAFDRMYAKVGRALVPPERLAHTLP